MAERTYGEGEIQALLERAAQLQAAAEDPGRPGLTLGELEQAAAEAGIDPAYLRAAVREAASGAGRRDVSGQTATHVFVERTVPGTLTDDEWEAVVLRLRKHYGSDLAASFGYGPLYGQGVTETIGRTREWRHVTSLGIATTVTVRSSDDVQHVRMQRRVGLSSPRVEGIGWGVIAALLPAFVAAGVTASGWVALAVFLAALVVAAPAITALDRRWRARKLDQLNTVADEIAALVRDETSDEDIHDAALDSVPTALPERELLSPLDLDTLPDVEGGERHRHRPRRTRA